MEHVIHNAGPIRKDQIDSKVFTIGGEPYTQVEKSIKPAWMRCKNDTTGEIIKITFPRVK